MTNDARNLKSPIESSAVNGLLSQEMVSSLAIPSNLRYGLAIFERGAVEFIEISSGHVEGWVGGLNGTMTEGGGQRRRVTFTAAATGLTWHCTGNPRDHQIFCKHCVGLALEILEHDSKGDSQGRT